jgi:hypothetical protein
VSLDGTGDPTDLLEGNLARRRDQVGDQYTSFQSEPVLLPDEKTRGLKWRFEKLSLAS